MLYFPIIVSAFSLIFVFFLNRQIQTQKTLTEANLVTETFQIIIAFLKRRFRTVALVAFPLFFLLWFIFGFKSGVAFLIGAIASVLAGFVAMTASFQNKEFPELSFKNGSVAGLSVAGFALLIVSVFYLLTNDLGALIFLGLGGSLISAFARIGKGVFALATDLFGTNVIILISAMMLAGTLFSADSLLVFLPLVLGATAILASIIASFFVRLAKNQNIILGISVLLTAVGFFPLIKKIVSLASLSLSGNKIYLVSLMGLVMLAGIFMITEYLASKKHKPVKMVASASQNNQASNIIVGLAVSMQATVLPGLLICFGILVSFWLAGIYGIALAAVAMVSSAGMVISIHAFGNNAKSFADSYAIVSAGLASLVLFFNFSQELTISVARLNFSFDDPRVIAGLFLGGLIPYLFSFLIITRAGFVSGLILVLTPIAVGFVLGPLVLAGVLVGSILTGLFLAIFMTLGGSVWSNARKHIEEGNYGGKDSSAFQAAVVGEAIADPFKDAVGPGISILNKAMNIVALIIVRFLI